MLAAVEELRLSGNLPRAAGAPIARSCRDSIARVKKLAPDERRRHKAPLKVVSEPCPAPDR